MSDNYDGPALAGQIIKLKARVKELEAHEKEQSAFIVQMNSEQATLRNAIHGEEGYENQLKELKAEDKMQDQMRSTIIKELASVVAENARLQKLVDMNQKVVDAARKYVTASELPSHCVTLTQTMEYRTTLRESLRDLDGEKKCKHGPELTCHLESCPNRGVV